MGLQTWQYLLGISYPSTSNQSSVYSSDFQFNQSMSLADSRQSLNSSASQNSLSEAQNEILSTIENHFKMLNDKLQKKEQLENYMGIIIGFTSLTSSFLISLPFSIIRNRSRALSLADPNQIELIKLFSNFSEFPEGRLIFECCCESLLYQSCFTLTEDISNSIKNLMENPNDKKKEEKNKKIKKNIQTKKSKSALIKATIIKSIGFIISYPMYKSFICHPINYPKNMFQNYIDVFSSIKRKIVNSFIRDSFKSKAQGIITSSSLNQTHSSMINSSSYEHSYLEYMRIINTTKWYSKFFTTVFYWVSYDVVENLIYKAINHIYTNNDNNSNTKKGKELKRKSIPNSSSNRNNGNHDQNGLDEHTFPQSIPNSSSQEQPTSKEQRQSNGRTPQHSKVIKVSTTMLKRVFIDVFCRLASSIITKVITYPIDTICIKLLTNGTEIKTNYRSSSSNQNKHSIPISKSYPLLNKNIHGFWSCCKVIHQTKGILGFYENFLCGMIPEIILNTIILEITYYATNYLLKYVESKYKIIPKFHHRRRKSKK